MQNAMRALFVCLGSWIVAGCGPRHADLAARFQNPPDRARPHTWWHWMNGNVTREGITADLEAMKKIGLGGAQLFNVSEHIPPGPVAIMSPEWRALVKHAANEADRLGLELCLHNCGGWSSSGGPWITPEYAMQMVVTSETKATGPTEFASVLPMPPTNRDYYKDIAVLAFPTPRDNATRIKDIKPKAGYEARYDQQPDLAAVAADAVISRGAMVDVTAQLQADGRFTWSVPAGEWTILRIGYTPTGAVNAPSPESGRGLECDKLSRAALDQHWAGMMGPVIADLGPLAGRTLNNSLIDSYEVGHQNWTPQFREEFQKRRGYDPLLFLPTLAGRIVDGGGESERFLWDLRRTIADLFADNYYTYFAELCRKNGMLASIEPYDGPFECLLTGRDADIPMGEFWVGGGESTSCKLAASVAHTYGRNIVGAEAFTAEPGRGRWQNHPYSLKAVGDLMYCAGINRYIIHRYAHQPWTNVVPGMTMGQWGTHFERTNTWWEHGGPEWIAYLARCQVMLQQGRFVADVCYYAGEAAPNNAPYKPELKARGYDYDACNPDVLLSRMTVENGRMVLPDGMSYRVLVLPDSKFMTPAVARKLQALIEKGATVIGPRPSASPSLSDQPRADAELQDIAKALWGDCDGATVKENKCGEGRVIWGEPVESVLGQMKIAPDCEFASAGPPPKMAWIHRVLGGADIYFVSNQRPFAADVDCTFRVSGKMPEFWHADSGTMEVAPIWSAADGRTTVPIHFDPAGSVFVVFRENAVASEHFTRIERSGDSLAQKTPRIEVQRATYEAIDGTGGVDVTEEVAALAKSGETSIPATNGLFGDPTYNHRKRLRVEYSVDGRPISQSVEENGLLELVAISGVTGLPPYRFASGDNGRLQLTAFEAGEFVTQTSAGKSTSVKVDSPAAPIAVSGPWKFRMPRAGGADVLTVFEKLISWTDHPGEDIRYFSGTAEYETSFGVSAELLAQGRALYLDLGRVCYIAEASLNDTKLGTWWKPPFAADISKVARAGSNSLKVRVTNLWPNRLIGDAQLPDDCEWQGIHLKAWPQWFVDKSPRPSSKRTTFTTWRHYTRESPLLESGLIGPVMLHSAARVTLE